MPTFIDGRANDPSCLLGDFQYKGTKTATAVDFTYDAAGNLTQDNNKGTTITYNYTNRPLHITIGTKGTFDYLYDATGSKLEKRITDNSVAGKTVILVASYINGFEYASRTTTPVDVNNPDYTDLSKTMMTAEGWVWFLNTAINMITGTAVDYFLRDRLGSVRMVLTDEQQVDIYPVVTLEETAQSTDPVAVENKYYSITTGQIVASSTITGISAYQNNNGSYPANNDPNYNSKSFIKDVDLSQKVYRINQANTPKTCLGIMLKVMSGDR